MNASNESTAAKQMREWWVSPPRTGIQRWIAPPEYRHLRAVGVTRIAGGVVAAVVGVVCLSYEAYGWTAFFLVVSALNFAGGYWELTLARSSTGREAPTPQS